MGTNQLTVRRYKDPDEAPMYKQPEFKGASLLEAGIVHNGTVNGNDTVDLVFTDDQGQKYVAMITMELLRSVVQVVQ